MNTKHHLIQLGHGNVGQALVRQVQSSQDRLQQQTGPELIYCGLFTSKRGAFDPAGLSPQTLQTLPAAKTADAQLAVESVPLPFTLIDATSSNETFPLLERALRRGGTVVLANKRPLAGSQKNFDALTRAGRGRLFFEATVGAGLPIIGPLEDLLDTGDKITSIQGCFSGTLGYILSELDAGKPYSAAVTAAARLGFSEPDPREDLSGMDVARKAVILSRVIGRRIEPADLVPEVLFPPHLAKLPVAAFLSHLPELDAGLAARFQEARRRGSTFRYVASVTPTDAGVGLQEVRATSDIGALTGPDNIIAIHTQRYAQNPIVVKGPGAGPEVTAAGLFADILRSAR